MKLLCYVEDLSEAFYDEGGSFWLCHRFWFHAFWSIVFWPTFIWSTASVGQQQRGDIQ